MVDFASASALKLLASAVGAFNSKAPALTDLRSAESLAELCVRREVLAAKTALGDQRPDVTTAADLTITREISDSVLKLAVRALAPGLLARWQCQDCGMIHENAEGAGAGVFVEQPGACGGGDGACVGTNHAPISTRLEAATYYTDVIGVLDVGDQRAPVVVSVYSKTANWPIPRTREEALDAVRMKASVDMWLTGYTRALVLTTGIDMGGFSFGGRDGLSAKFIDFDRTEVERAVSIGSDLAAAAQAATGLAPHVLPPRRCMADDVTRAVSCPLREQCFGSE
jgi:hypothetical protein